MRYRRGSKLSDEQALAIFDSQAPGPVLAERYGITVVMVHYIRSGKRFRALIERERPERAAQLRPADRWSAELRRYV